MFADKKNSKTFPELSRTVKTFPQPSWSLRTLKYHYKQQSLNPVHKVLHKAYGLWNAEYFEIYLIILFQ